MVVNRTTDVTSLGDRYRNSVENTLGTDKINPKYAMHITSINKYLHVHKV